MDTRKNTTVRRDEKGYPLYADGSIDWKLLAEEKQDELNKFERREDTSKVRRKHPTNRIPPKKKRK